MWLFVAMSRLFLASLFTNADGHPTRATRDDVTTTMAPNQTWNISSFSVNASSSSTLQPTGPSLLSPESSTMSERNEAQSEPLITIPYIALETSAAFTLSNSEGVSEESILTICQSTFDVSSGSIDGGCPDEGDSFISPSMDEVEGNGTFATEDRWVWSSIRWTPWIIIQMLLAIFGIIGNALVIVVMYQYRKTNRVMDTLIATLAVADLLTSLFVIPLPTATRVPNNWAGQTYCKIVLSSVLMWANLSVSTYLLIAISIERYVAVIHPFYFTTILNRQRIKLMIVLIWVLNYLVTATFSYFIVNSHAGRCTMIFSNNIISIFVGTALFAYRVFIPSLVMVITQVLIARKLYRQASWFKSKTGAAAEDNIHLAARSRVIQLMLIVILIYVFCWSPSQFAFLLYTLSVIPAWYPYSIYHRTLTLIGFFNSCANPIIYTLRHTQFRQAILDIFKRDVNRGDPLFGAHLLKRQKADHVLCRK